MRSYRIRRSESKNFIVIFLAADGAAQSATLRCGENGLLQSNPKPVIKLLAAMSRFTIGRQARFGSGIMLKIGLITGRSIARPYEAHLLRILSEGHPSDRPTRRDPGNPYQGTSLLAQYGLYCPEDVLW
jgi:hypothetical protein